MVVQERVLLCRPHGGLNDTLDVIEHCWRYAERTNRQLILDMSRSSFCTNFGKLFKNRFDDNSTLFEISNSIIEQLNMKSCSLPEIEGRVGQYVTRIQLHDTISHLEWRMPVEDSSSKSLAISFDEEYSEDLVVHENFRSGAMASSLLRRLKFQKSVSDEISARLVNLRSQEYLGIHVRNSDIKSDYHEFFARMKDKLNNQIVLICSDDYQVIEYAKRYLENSVVLTSSEIPDLGGQPYQIPFVDGEEARNKLSLDALVDLIALGESQELFSTLIVNREIAHSGFSQLAAELCADKSIAKALFD
jgi:hypothetical protein